MRRPRCARWCRSLVTIERSDRLKPKKPASDRRLFLWRQFALSVSKASKPLARLPFDFAATRLRSGRTVDGARRMEGGALRQRVGWGERSDAQHALQPPEKRWASLRSPQPTLIMHNSGLLWERGSAPAGSYRVTPLAPERAGCHARPGCRLPTFELVQQHQPHHAAHGVGVESLRGDLRL